MVIIDKPHVLACVVEQYRPVSQIIQEVAFVRRAELDEQFGMRVSLLLFHLKHDLLVEFCLDEAKTHVFFRLTSLGLKRKIEFIELHPEIAKLQEDFLLSNCPT